jgi:hypothetical protein
VSEAEDRFALWAIDIVSPRLSLKRILMAIGNVSSVLTLWLESIRPKLSLLSVEQPCAQV